MREINSWEMMGNLRASDMEICLGLKTPTPEVIREYVRRFEQNDYAANTEKAIRRLVDAFPGIWLYRCIVIVDGVNGYA